VEKADKVIADVGARIAELRRDKGWTQQEFAERIKMEPQSVQRIERGTNLTIRSLVKVARTLGVPTISLFEAPASHERRPGRPKTM
jgi:transcriptional regulator with XRE-family HTH domain